MKKILLSTALLLLVSFGFAQLNAFQKASNKKIVFYNTWLQSRLDETASDASAEGELGKPFWFRAYFENADVPKQKDNHLDLRISCAGTSVTLNDMFLFAKENFYSSNGILPNYDQIQIPGLDNFWKSNNIFSCNGFSPNDDFDKFNNYGCQNNGFYAESLLRFLLAKIDSKVVPGAVLELKYELVNRSKGEWRMPGAEFATLAEGTYKMKVPAKEGAINSQIYRCVEMPGMNDKAMNDGIKSAMLSQAQNVISEVYKVQVLNSGYNNDRGNNNVVLNRWVTARVVYRSKVTGMVFTGKVNVVYNFDGANYDKNVSKLFFQCGNTFAPSFAVK